MELYTYEEKSVYIIFEHLKIILVIVLELMHSLRKYGVFDMSLSRNLLNKGSCDRKFFSRRQQFSYFFYIELVNKVIRVPIPKYY